MPKKLLKFQNMLFRLMPNSMFKQIGFKKADVINLCNTMSELDFSDSLCTELDNSEFDEVKEYEWKTSISYICRVDR